MPGKIPRWFDESIAVVVANEARHADENWKEIQRQGLPTPKSDELISFSDWGAAVNKYGETVGDVPSNLLVVYTTAGHEVREFLSCAGPNSVTSILRSVNAGSAFDVAYTGVRGKCAR